MRLAARCASSLIGLVPELLEIEMYRRGALPVVGRTITHVQAPDDWYLKGGLDAQAASDALTGATITGLNRIGKLMIVDTSQVQVGLRFGMTGRLLIDNEPVIAELEYSSKRLDPDWNRFGVTFSDGSELTMNDPRRLGGVELNPDETKLGPDAWGITEDQLVAIFAKYSVATKALLLNQKRIAGLGNLLVDELLWRGSVRPDRSAKDVSVDDVRQLANILRPMLDELYERGGSNCGDLFVERRPEGRCPTDGAELTHGEVGGRSTWWCSEHQH